MRVSSDKADPGYADWCKLNGDRKIVTVYLDGEKVRDAVMADEEAGEVRRCVRTEADNLAFDKKTGDILRETLRGKVKVVVEDRF
ncbi:hypothetical protein [Rhizobium sp. LCM 4573]|uniref:hypothetical protein n=1 Tax=Rhizobium sp. LCM 4573 TaxID=1848291 RepID=UPI0008DB22AE|nr:hypothetical protein [Rhizobium sp. LCM 4573]OHV81613.1 hypothetical protein LCM4573_21245 [Rhizobium sp. LCM 4573]